MTIRAQVLVRDPERERRFAERAAQCAGTSGFVEQVLARLEEGERKFGDRWKGLSLEDFLRELSEEAADLGSWSALADQAFAQARHTDLLDAHLAAAFLEVARCGAKAARAIDAARRMIRHAHDPGRA